MQTIVNDGTILFLGILLEALPFVMFGSIIASAIGLFVSDNLLVRFIPKNRMAGFVIVSLLGILFPVCDCAIVPVMRRLIRKGLPPSLAITFMCAVPIVNPAVIASTWWAFTYQPHIVWLRMLVGISTAITAGYVVGKLTKEKNPLRNDTYECNHNGCACGNNTNLNPLPVARWENVVNHIGLFLNHTTKEFINNSALIMTGALLSAIIQVVLPRTIMYPLSTNPIASVWVMMGFTWLISLCSNADAFVAKSFYGLFTTGSVVAFMTFGQMIDLKNTVVLLGFFKKRFVVTATLVIVVLCFLWGLMINFLGGGL
jgi:uncharacterized membrane protein YraQ (UPF0718 family)